MTRRQRRDNGGATLGDWVADYIRRELTEPVRVAKNVIIAANLVLLYLEESDVFSIRKWCANVRRGVDSDALSADYLLRVTASMFTHGDARHCVSNMVMLHVFTATLPEDYGLARYLLTYFGSGVAGFVANIQLAKSHRLEWQRRLAQSAQGARMVCDEWWCESTGWNSVARNLAVGIEATANAPAFAAMFMNEVTHRVGASAAVYGIIGATMLVRGSTFMREGIRTGIMDLAALLRIVSDLEDVGAEMKHVPWSFDGLFDKVFRDNVDHTAHAGGVLFGMLFAAVAYWRW